MKEKILLLVDYRDYFYIACGKGDACMNVSLLVESFKKLGFEAEVRHFADISLRNDNFKKWWVVYQSSEDHLLQYKSYIGDVLLGLQYQGARLIPRMECFHAHHNKVFMEMLRDLSDLDAIKNISSHGFGCLEELNRNIGGIEFPAVIKPSAGQGSSGVALAKGPDELRRYARVLSRTFNFRDFVKNIAKKILGRPEKSLHRCKFVVQNYIAGLKEDYKVVILGSRYYLLRRKNRENDFRASGSGIFEYPCNAHKELRHILYFCHQVYSTFDCPLLSLDVGTDGSTCYLLEFQFLHFGTYTAERSDCYYRLCGDGWEEVREKCELESVAAIAITDYIVSKNTELNQFVS
jgi:hypothetical protein